MGIGVHPRSLKQPNKMFENEAMGPQSFQAGSYVHEPPPPQRTGLSESLRLPCELEVSLGWWSY